MKKLKVNKEARCMACLACVRACSEAYYKVFDPDKSRIQVIEKNGEPKHMVCIQCGKCAKVCEAGAIKQNAKGVYVVDKKLCVGCGKCAEVCPFKVVVNENPAAKCISCGLCVKACPMDVLEIVES